MRACNSFSSRLTGRWVVVFVTALVSVAGCRGGNKSDSAKAARGGAAQTAEVVVVKKPDLPRDLGQCPYSGPMADYLRGLGELDEGAQRSATATWAALQGAGATDGYVSVHTGLRQACTFLVSGSPPGHDRDHFRRSLISFVIQFKDRAAAEAAYGEDILKQSEVQGQSGAEVGDKTGLGSRSAVWSNESSWSTGTPGPKAYQAVWQEGPFYFSIKTENLSRAEAHASALAEHGRVG